jgi:hypothetical protein
MSMNFVIITIFLTSLNYFTYMKSRDSSVGVALGYGLDDRGSILGEARNFSHHHHVQNDSGAHPVSYPMGTRGSFSGSKAAGS